MIMSEVYSEKKFTHYAVSDGRYWSIEDAGFVEGLPEGAVCGLCAPEKEESTVEALIACLDFFHLPKGELKTDAEYAAEVREKRNALIAETDYMAMPDYPLDDEKKTAILAYRQALRDVPEQEGFPRRIDWPVKP